MAPRSTAAGGTPLARLLWAGAAVRTLLLGWGAWQDAHLAVKFTDIDYEVYTDAAAFMAAGRSPYTRSTYRYTPLLAAALLPNVALHKAWGKLLFCFADLAAAWMLTRLLAARRRQGGSSTAPAVWQTAGVALWLFSPFTVAISTRGNGEALVTCLLLGMLLALQAGRLTLAALLFGLAVHWRLYPIIFALPLLRHFALPLLRHFALQRRSASAAAGRTPANGSKSRASISRSHAARLAGAAAQLLSLRGAAFGALSGALFLALGAACYRLYGWQFLHETYLYHASRTDPRHNFSPYFYPAYLASTGGTAATWDVGWAFSLAQAALQLAVGWACAADLPFCFLLQTMVLVAFNKVCTAQYFVWYISFLPLMLPDLAAAPNRRRLLGAAAAWGAAMAHWLLWAYLLEFQGAGVHLAVWCASLAFLTAHVWLICELLAAWRARQGGAGRRHATGGQRKAA
ncbi:hypothetical protein ABPG75_008507 [Micractinium tetrahymenae]